MIENVVYVTLRYQAVAMKQLCIYKHKSAVQAAHKTATITMETSNNLYPRTYTMANGGKLNKLVVSCCVIYITAMHS